MNSAAFAALMTVLTAGMVSSFGAFVVVFRKFKDNKRVLMHLNSKG
jgi:hypothetical protein